MKQPTLTGLLEPAMHPLPKAKSATAQEIDRLNAAALRVLARLKEGPATNVELSRTICLRFGARLLELRAHGWLIDTEHVEKGLFRYTLKGQQ